MGHCFLGVMWPKIILKSYGRISQVSLKFSDYIDILLPLTSGNIENCYSTVEPFLTDTPQQMLVPNGVCFRGSTVFHEMLYPINRLYVHVDSILLSSTPACSDTLSTPSPFQLTLFYIAHIPTLIHMQLRHFISYGPILNS